MSNQPRTVTISDNLARLLQRVAGYQPDSQLPFQRQFESAIGILLALYDTIGPVTRARLRQVVEEANANRPDASDSDPNPDNT